MKKALKTIAAIIIMILLSLAFGLCAVFPLWKWATSSPKSYTFATIAAFAGFIIWKTVSRTIQNKKNQ